jgi:hypothetical protein
MVIGTFPRHRTVYFGPCQEWWGTRRSGVNVEDQADRVDEEWCWSAADAAICTACHGVDATP